MMFSNPSSRNGLGRHSIRPQHVARRSKLLVFVSSAIVAVMVSFLTTPMAESAGLGGMSARAGATGVGDKVAAPLRQLFATSGATQDFWVIFTSSANTHQAAAITEWTKRGVGVVDALKTTARQSQQGVVTLLTSQGASFEPFWITNAIKVRGGSYPLALSLAAQPGVDKVVAPVKYEQPAPLNPKDTDPRLGAAAATAGATANGVTSPQARASQPDVCNVSNNWS